MAEHSKIGWTDATWNPWQGCTKVSPGCDHCYAEALDRRRGKDFSVVRRSTNATFSAPLRWERKAAAEGKELMVFTCSISDFFHQRAAPWREAAWTIMGRTPHLTYQVLTKRPGLMAHWAETHRWLPNVWAGTSVESAKYLPRLDVLLRVPAPVRFVSCEPLLGPLDLRPYLPMTSKSDSGWDIGGLDWVIVGGESGPQHRPMDLAWVRAIRDQCVAAGVPFHYKQGAAPYQGSDRLLDGRFWNEVPPLEVIGETPNADRVQGLLALQ